MKLRYPTVLFDWDGTLGDTLSVWMQAYREVSAEYGLTPSDKEIGGQFGDWHGVLKLGLDAADFEPFWLRMQPILEERLPKVQLYAGAAELLARLTEAGANVGLVTTSTRALVLPALEKHRIDHHFRAIVAGDDVVEHKPHREPIDKAAAALGVGLEGAVMVGDSDKDLGAATSAGIPSVLLHLADHAVFYERGELEAHSPTHVATSFDELAAILIER